MTSSFDAACLSTNVVLSQAEVQANELSKALPSAQKLVEWTLSRLHGNSPNILPTMTSEFGTKACGGYALQFIPIPNPWLITKLLRSEAR